MRQYNAGGLPFGVLRTANPIGPKEAKIRYWLLHLWIRAHLALTLPLHLDQSLLQTPFSLTYTPDVGQAVILAISKARNETCCPEHVEGEAFNLACELTPTQRDFYNLLAEPIGLPYVETMELERNQSVVLFPDHQRRAVSIQKAQEVLRFAPTDLSKALRSVARFYNRVMLDEKKYRGELKQIYAKCERMLSGDGPRFVEWTRAFYAEQRKTELYDEVDDEDEDDIVLSRPLPRKRRRRRRAGGTSARGGEL